MRFAHLADCHIGGWREEELKELGMRSFEAAIERCLHEKVDFLLIAGDLFNTALPSIDLLKRTTTALKRVKDAQIPVYLIPGSHDFSPSGKTMLDILEEAGLVANVVRFKEGKLQWTSTPQGVKITGLMGKRGGLEIQDYLHLDKAHLETEEGFKIFMFHTTLSEFKPAGMEQVEGAPVAALPRNCQYYAGGHVHYRFQTRYGTGLLTYPGPTFPNNFKELEELQHGSFYLVDDQLNYELVTLPLKEVIALKIDAEDKTPEEVESSLHQALPEETQDKILLLRVEGTLRSGRPSDIRFAKILETHKGAYCVLRNTSRLKSRTFEEFEVESGHDVEEVEAKIIETHAEQAPPGAVDKEAEIRLTQALMQALDKEKQEGEKTVDFEARILQDAWKALGISA